MARRICENCDGLGHTDMGLTICPDCLDTGYTTPQLTALIAANDVRERNLPRLGSPVYCGHCKKTVKFHMADPCGFGGCPHGGDF